ncbi:hypothetical protein OHB41_46330 [Streptomyces sp. NBC_01571]|uniref:hypothetical protein n=1 Tax=Streptomyces sp. NBC_01571 TaxID=2975883 RepID=UPI00225661AB|nr:hypothetical protein [Streptomyces sp. NBC_01571]MCX4580453.1 hypothetical protein [Streptomyces sp. NBC_01571]
MATGHFTVADPVIALTVVNGGLLALLELWFNRPEPHMDQAAQTMAEMLLHMFGLFPHEARLVRAGRVEPVGVGEPLIVRHGRDVQQPLLGAQLDMRAEREAPTATDRGTPPVGRQPRARSRL